MHSLILFITLFVALISADTETRRVACPKGFQHVSGAGCQKMNETCRCPETPCAFPLKCDCEGSCAPKTCTTQRQCSLLRNRLDLCDKAVCQEGLCVLERETCAGCDAKTGCPGRHSSSSTTTESVDLEQQQEESGDDAKLSVQHHDDDDDWSPPSASEPVGWQVYLTVALFLVMSLLFIGIMIYFAVTAYRTMA